ncbi:hypothetical protein [Croceicoccus gelatinilyticus]|uniref:hypothetical protein n=1 Tax=Croceicoccus gelatinilyticus TaxID=2835536 RepID=UPI001BCBEE2E|nr:hypothetical protein [Croceicoccus gelatinilyticus]MBS7669388.1 hypothetical protein [Croceicoccus gelatinilyticus]
MRDPSRAFVANYETGAVPFDYVREGYQFQTCDESHTTTRITSCKPEYVWSAKNVLAKLYSLDEDMRRKRAIPLSWEGHLELSDWSEAMTPRTAVRH